MAKATVAGEVVVKTGKPGKAPAPAKPGLFARLGNYFRDVRSETKRVVWPTRPEVLNSSVVVIVTLIFFAGFIALTDLVVQRIINLLASIPVGR
jgi:preprotein translocase subunit SecE